MATALQSNIQSYQTNLIGKIHPAAQQAISLLFSAIQDHDTAIVALNGKVASGTAPTSPTTPSPPSTPSIPSFPYLGGVNVQTGTAYATQLTDNGVLLVMSNAGSMAVTLTSTVTAPFFMSFLNLGGASAVLTPSTGKVNNAASITVLSAGWAILYFDGTNWWSMASPVLPVTTAAITHEWLASYNAVTGAFTQTQPAFSDISGSATAAQVPSLSALSGQITAGQLPAGGQSVTIITASLTSLGSQGSMTFVDGQLTAQTQAT